MASDSCKDKACQQSDGHCWGDILHGLRPLPWGVGETKRARRGQRRWCLIQREAHICPVTPWMMPRGEKSKQWRAQAVPPGCYLGFLVGTNPPSPPHRVQPLGFLSRPGRGHPEAQRRTRTGGQLGGSCWPLSTREASLDYIVSTRPS